MSYLDVPRLHFFGHFSANPSTLNNIPANYNLPPDPNRSNEYASDWNQMGDHSWLLQDCTVQTVIGRDGSPSQDPLVGAAVYAVGTQQGSNPKLVDLDPQQQYVSMIFGLQIQIGDPASVWVRGDFLPQPFLDIAPDLQYAYYQSVLQHLKWSPDLASPVLQELQRISPDALSIKFNLMLTSWGPPAKGTITGTIGPAAPGEPPNFLIGRLMRPTVIPDQTAIRGHGYGHMPAQPAQPNRYYNYTPFVVDNHRGKVIVDFGNSQTAGVQGTMQVAILPGQSSPQILGTVDTKLHSYQTTAAIQEFDVTAEQISLLRSSRLGVLSGESSVLAEDENATSLAVTPLVCRLNPGDEIQISLVALSFGSPAANQTIGIQMDISQIGVYNETTAPSIGVPSNALRFPSSVTTGAGGRASFTLAASPEGPGNPRGPIDGQVYGLVFSWPLASNLDPWVFVSVRAYDLVPVPASPDWETDVSPILTPYGELYPYMGKTIGIHLTRRHSVHENAQEIAYRLELPETDPRHMPVSRDLSANKTQIVLNWLKQHGKGGAGSTA